MRRLMGVLVIAAAITGCAGPGFRPGHSTLPLSLGGGQFLLEAYTNETGLERAREHCGTKEAVVTDMRRPVGAWQWTQVYFVCR